MNPNTRRVLFAVLPILVPVVASIAFSVLMTLPPQATSHVPLFGPSGGGRGVH